MAGLTPEKTEQEKSPKRSWWKRLGWGAFIFFLLKGIFWLVGGAALLKLISC
jgi:hypothetical protein